VSVYVVNNSFSPELREDQVRNIDEYSKFCIDIKIETMENIEAGVLLVGKVTDVKNLGNEGDTLIYHQDTFNYTKPL
jgi:flavin reductase (DIM6/NTAB) family NADH-FMN oxidoreductase RutF